MGDLYNPYPKLPKNIRQIGERDQVVKLYVEDYVNTYLKRLYPMGGQDLRAGLLLGNVETHDGTPYIFIDGAMEMEDVTQNGERVEFTELAWKRAYQDMEQMFPHRTVQGWFLCGAAGSQLSPLNYWKEHGQYFSGKNQLMYLNSGMEGEEAIYVTSEDGFYHLQGHAIYYERNQMMQDYMVLRKDSKRVETGNDDSIIRDFRQRMEDKKTEVNTRKSTVNLLGGLCSALAVVVMAGGIVMFNNYEKMKELEGVIASVVPADFKTKESQGRLPDEEEIILEEASGEVYPTTEPFIEEAVPVTEAESVAAPVGQAPSSSAPAETGKPVAESQEGTKAAAETTAPSKAQEEKSEAETTAQPKVPEETRPSKDQIEAAAAAGKIYIVGDGETLYGICYKLYGNLNQLEKICQLNGLSDQNRIISGQNLILP